VSDEVVADTDAATGRRVGIAGPLLGGNAGWVTNPGQVLADHWRAQGRDVRTTSDQVGRVRRLADTMGAVARWRGRVDVAIVLVYSGIGFSVAEATTLVARAVGLPVVHWLHGGNLPDFAAAHPRRVRRLLAQGSAVVAPSDYLAGAIEGIGEHAEVIPNLVDLDRLGWREHAPAAPRLVWMRTFHPLYDPELAVRALAVLRATHPDATLTMAGQDKGSRGEVQEVAADLGLGDAVAFPGYVEDADKAALFDAHDVFVNTNRVDNTPVSVLEAMGAGLPVVTTDAGGLPYLVTDGHSGLVVPVGDADAMAAAVGRVVDDPALAAILSRGGRAVAEASTWDAVGPRWDEVLGGVVG
jgi:glycosyltransferase involved in cell wall biosynthesis